jgi:hypothetical protein
VVVRAYLVFGGMRRRGGSADGREVLQTIGQRGSRACVAVVSY